jgi:hypothetical protein
VFLKRREKRKLTAEFGEGDEPTADSPTTPEIDTTTASKSDPTR